MPVSVEVIRRVERVDGRFRGKRGGRAGGDPVAALAGSMQRQLEKLLGEGRVGHYDVFGKWRPYGPVHEVSGPDLLDLRADIGRALADPSVVSHYGDLMLHLQDLVTLAIGEDGLMVVTPD